MAGAAAQEPALYEREGELRQLRAFSERVLGGEGGVLAIEGGAGIGKTRLLAAAGRVARDCGVRVLEASASELESDHPYGVVRQLFEPAWRAASDAQRARWSEGAARLGAALLTDLPGRAAEPSYGALYGIYWLAAAVASDGATVLLVDDLHWADRPSLRALAYLARRLDGLRLGLAVALRTGVPGDGETIAAILAAGAARTLVPAPLGDAGVAAAAADVLRRALPADCVHVCRRLTGGNPLLLRQLLEAVQQEGIELTPRSLGAVGELAPGSIARAVMLRVGRLPEEVGRLARAVAVLGDGAALRHAAELAELAPDDALAAAARLVATGIFAERRTLAFAHPLIRSGVYADLSAPARALLHGRAARIIARDADAAAVAPHLLAGAPAGDPWAVRTLRAAAAGALTHGATETAVACLRRALAEPPAAEHRSRVLAELGLAEAGGGEHAAAAGHLRAALAGELEPPRRRDAALALADALVVTDGAPAALALLASQHERLGGDDGLRLELERTRLAAFVPDLAADALRTMGSFAGLAGETPAERLALANAAAALGMSATARAGEVASVALRALGDGALARDPAAPTTAAGTALYFLLFTERLDAVERAVEHVLEQARLTGSANRFGVAAFTRCHMLQLRGQLVAAQAEGELLIRLLAELPDSPINVRTVAATVCWLTEIVLLRGDLDGARALVARSCAGRDLDDPQLALLHHARGLIALHDGAPEQARQELEIVGAVAQASGYEDRTTPWRLELARAHSALGDRAAATALADRQLALARTWGAPGGIGIALRARALAGAREQAAPLLRESIARLSEAGFAAQRAGSQIELGSLLRRDGSRRQAQEPLRAGLDGAARCGANALVARAHEELLLAGARPRRLAFSGVDSLTASEWRVAAMAASGMSNRQIAQTLFVALKTVESHLTRAYRKLDVTSRAELPAALAARD